MRFLIWMQYVAPGVTDNSGVVLYALSAPRVGHARLEHFGYGECGGGFLQTRGTYDADDLLSALAFLKQKKKIAKENAKGR